MAGGGGQRKAGQDLASLVTRRHDALRAQAPLARDGQPGGVHQARVASRRLREVVPVLGHGLSDVKLKRLRRHLRGLTRALGPVRELDVARAMIDELSLDTADSAQLAEAWRDHLDDLRRRPVRAMRKAVSWSNRRALDGELDAFAAARASSDDAAWRTALARRLALRAQTLRAHVERTGTRYQPGPLHEVRIAAKKLRYVLEITDETGLARLAGSLRTLKTAQEALGRLHDLDVLLTFLHSLPDAAPGRTLQHAAAAAVAGIEGDSRRLHARYLRAAPSLLRVADATAQVVVPRVLAIDAPHKDPAPDGR